VVPPGDRKRVSEGDHSGKLLLPLTSAVKLEQVTVRRFALRLCLPVLLFHPRDRLSSSLFLPGPARRHDLGLCLFLQLYLLHLVPSLLSLALQSADTPA
jgi:hypothetical protein